MKFMQTHKVYLTPISPIHIGCGEDFEPTNYVIDENVLYHFDPVNLKLNEQQRIDLLNRANNLDLLAIQRFFLNNKEQAVSFANYFADVVSGLANDYKNKIGKVAQRENDGNKVINNLSIERTAYLPLKHLPYIPGSSFKGVLATALLNYEHKKRNYPKVRKEDSKKLVQFYLGEFAESRLRTVKFGDFIPVKPAHSKIFYSLNFKKVPTQKGGKGKGITLRRECILAGQYRTFQSELTLWEGENLSVKSYFQLLNDYHKAIFAAECGMLFQRKLVSKEWISGVLKLIENNKVALIRLGKNGADSKVYQGDMAQIKIMKGKGKKPDFRSSATTVWLAAGQESQSSDLLPFGWAILEVDPTEDNELLKQWCEAQPKSQFDRVAPKFKKLRNKLVAE